MLSGCLDLRLGGDALAGAATDRRLPEALLGPRGPGRVERPTLAPSPSNAREFYTAALASTETPAEAVVRVPVA